MKSYFKRKGIQLHDTEADTWGIHKAADLPEDFDNPAKADEADPDAPYESPDIRNNLKKYGANINKIP